MSEIKQCLDTIIHAAENDTAMAEVLMSIQRQLGIDIDKLDRVIGKMTPGDTGVVDLYNIIDDFKRIIVAISQFEQMS